MNTDKSNTLIKELDYFNHSYTTNLTPYKGISFFDKVFIFPGQGVARPGMFKDLFEQDPIFIEFLKKTDEFSKTVGLTQVSNYIHQNNLSKMLPEELAIIRNLALFTTEIALFYSLVLKNIRPSAITSHSFGEFAAFVCGGIISFEDMLHIVYRRDKLSPPPQSIGKMVAIESNEAKIIDLFKNEISTSNIVISNYNSNKQIVLSIRPEAMQNALRVLKTNDIFYKELENVPQPYHTPWMKPTAKNLQLFLKEFPFKYTPPKYPVLSSVLKRFISQNDISRENLIHILSSQVTTPLNFTEQIKLLSRKNLSNFIELGPGNNCSQFISDILPTQKHKITLITKYFPRKEKIKERKITHTKERSKILKILNKVISTVTGYRIDEISIHNKFHEDLGIDSIKKAEIVFNVLDELNIDKDEKMIVLSDISNPLDIIEHASDRMRQKNKKESTDLKSKTDFQRFIQSYEKTPLSYLDTSFCKNFSLLHFNIKDLLLNPGELASTYLKHLSHAESPYVALILKADRNSIHVPSNSELINSDFKIFYESKLAPVLSSLQKMSQSIHELQNPAFLLFLCEKSTHPFLLSLNSLLKSVTLEHPSFFYKNIIFETLIEGEDIDHIINSELNEAIARDIYYDEFLNRYLKVYKQASLPKQSIPTLTSKPVIVFVGGTRGIGRQLADLLCTNFEIKLYILGTSDHSAVHVQETINFLREKNKETHYHQVNASDKDNLFSTLDSIVLKHKNIDILVNGAGIEVSKRLKDQSEEDISLGLFSKVQSAHNIFNYFKNKNISQILHHSSLAAELGNDGQSIYGLANDLMLQLSFQFNKEKKQAVSKVLLWPAWDKIGMTERPGVLEKLMLSGVTALSAKMGKGLFLGELFEFESEKVLYLDKENFNQYSISLVKRTHHIPFNGLLCMSNNSDLSGINLNDQPYLKDHKLKNNPVYPASSALALMSYASYTYFKKYPVIKNFEARNLLLVHDAPTKIALRTTTTPDNDQLNMEIASNIVHFSSTASIDKKEKTSLLEDIPEIEGSLDMKFLYNNDIIELGAKYQYLKAKIYYTKAKSVIFKVDGNFHHKYTESGMFDSLQQIIEQAFQALGNDLLWRTKSYYIPHFIKEFSFNPSTMEKEMYAMVKFLTIRDKKALADIIVFNKNKNITMEISSIKMNLLQEDNWSTENRFITKKEDVSL